MALSDLQVFQEYTYLSYSEALPQNVNAFNTAVGGAIVLRPGSHRGDFVETAIWAKISGLVRRRNAYGTGAVTEVALKQLLDVAVRVAAGCPPLRIDPGMLKWIQSSEEEAGTVIGEQLAKDTIADMLNASLLAGRVALVNEGTNYYDATGVGAGTATLPILNTGAAKLGDRSGDLKCWISHSKPLFDMYGAALANSNYLFNIGNVKVTRDALGNPLVMTDSASLVATGPVYYLLGLVAGALVVDQNDDFDQNVQKVNGDENIKATYQAEWSYQVGCKGFAWDKTNGGASPSDAALGTGTNWDKYASSAKDYAGVVVKVK
jgi:hypothetical protein